MIYNKNKQEVARSKIEALRARRDQLLADLDRIAAHPDCIRQHGGRVLDFVSSDQGRCELQRLAKKYGMPVRLLHTLVGLLVRDAPPIEFFAQRRKLFKAIECFPTTQEALANRAVYMELQSMAVRWARWLPEEEYVFLTREQ